MAAHHDLGFGIRDGSRPHGASAQSKSHSGSLVALVFTIGYFVYLGVGALAVAPPVFASLIVMGAILLGVLITALLLDAHSRRSDSTDTAIQNEQLKALLQLLAQSRTRSSAPEQTSDDSSSDDRLIASLWDMLENKGRFDE
jgi:hypothetical protein